MKFSIRPRTKIIIASVLIIGIVGVRILGYFKPNEKDPACTGKERWGIKTLGDGDASKINFTADSSTIAQLISIAPENSPSKNTSRFGIEFNTYIIRCRIREYKLTDDGDYHLVLEDLNDPSKTMIGEIPDPYCESVKKSLRFEQIVKSRNDFKNTRLFTMGNDNAVYTITGVAFYDKIHGQRGGAPYGTEIHPVLSISEK